MKTIYIDGKTKQEINEIKAFRGLGSTSINEFLHRLADALERYKRTR